MHSLPLFVRLADRPVILLGEGYMADAKARLLARAGATIVGEDSEAAIAVVAIMEEAEAEAAVARLKARGILVNAVDRPDLSDFTFPAIVDRDPVLIAIGTGGASAGLAAALRQRLETILPASLGEVAQALHGARAFFRGRFPALDDRRRAIADLLAPGGALDPMTEQADPAAAIAQARPAQDRSERLAITSADPDELTLRAARLLGLTDRIYHAGDIPPAILDRARGDAQRIVGPAPAFPEPGLTLELVWMP
jgi:uroporphyrin-III C-methyltransferase/precorrin-2 dehydrogenase/sirohydrochlorin ferrochelatase